MIRIKIALLAVVLLQGCSTTDVNRITGGAVDGALREMIGDVTSSSTASDTRTSSANQSYVKKERVRIVQPTRASRDYGNIILLEKRKNSRSQTKLALDSCSHTRIGPIDCEVYVYEVAPDGRLVEKGRSLTGAAGPEIVLAAGPYYVKAVNNISSTAHATTGIVEVEPFVTNVIRLELE